MDKFVDEQKLRYDKEAIQHAEHYGDPYTQAYREKFIRRYLFRRKLDGAFVLDAMSASGIETGYLLRRGANVIGLDISPENAIQYREKWGLDCEVLSIHKTKFPNETFDAVLIMGGLHHILPLLGETLNEIHRILKPNGIFYFAEPNKDTWVNKLREYWYANDDRFGDEESGISYPTELAKFLDIGFEECYVNYGGNVAYMFIGQSLALGIPKWIKRYIAKPLFFLEWILNKLPFAPQLFFSAAWRKK